MPKYYLDYEEPEEDLNEGKGIMRETEEEYPNINQTVNMRKRIQIE